MSLRLNPRVLKSEHLERCCLDDCQAACCLHGVWVDLREAEDLLDCAALIAPEMKGQFKDPEAWFAGATEEDEHSISGKVVHTRVVDDPTHYGGTACVFLRVDHKCALQVAGERAGLHPWRFKPFYCILQPLDFDKQGRITLDKTSVLLNEKGSCLRRSPRRTPLVITFEPELTYLLGKKEYHVILDMALRTMEANPADYRRS